jgi:myo-inositol-1(or 4)-monophosphatase
MLRCNKISGQAPLTHPGTALTHASHENRLAAAIIDAAHGAGTLALAFYRPDEETSARMFHKDGGSPVTEADYLVDRYLSERLRSLVPQAGWLSEESEDNLARLSKDQLLVIDPIDGTRAFMRGKPGWAIAIALIAQGRPQIGIVHAPALGETYAAVRGAGAFLNGKAIAVSKRAAFGEGARIAAPAFVAERLRQAGLVFDLQPRISSLALRIINVASGALDAGYASGHANDWDIAAADLILEEAGGRLTSLDGREIIYNRKETSHGPLIAAPVQLHAEANAAAVAASRER